MTSHFASLSAASGGAAPVNVSELDALMQHVSNMAPGAEQQQLLAMIDMLLQLHQQTPTGTGSNTATSTGAADGTDQAASPSQAALPSSNATSSSSFGHDFGTPGGVLPPTSSSSSASNNGTGTGSSNSSQFGSSSAYSTWGVPNALAGANGSATATESSAALGAAFAPLGTSARNAADLTFPQASQTNSSNASDWMSLPQFQPTSVGSSNALSTHSSGASALLSSVGSQSSGLASFSSPLRPARTDASGGYRDSVPESASPFASPYESYTNLSVTARPFQPSHSSVTAQQQQQQQQLGGLGAHGHGHGAGSSAHGMDLSEGAQVDDASHEHGLSGGVNADLSASLAAVSDAARSLFDLPQAGGHEQGYDVNGGLDGGAGYNGAGLGAGNRIRPRFDGASGTGSGYGGRGGFSGSGGYRGSTGGGAYDSRRSGGVGGAGRSSEYARSGLDRFDYIQQQVNFASKSKRGAPASFADSPDALLSGAPRGNTNSGAVGGAGANRDFLPGVGTEDFISSVSTASPLTGMSTAQPPLSSTAHVPPQIQQPQPLATASPEHLTPSQQQLLALLPQMLQAANANAATSASPSASVLDAEAALRQLQASPEFSSLTPAQHDSIYRSVQQISDRQQQAAAAAVAASNGGAQGKSESIPPSSGASASGASPSPSAPSVPAVYQAPVKQDLEKLALLLSAQKAAVNSAAQSVAHNSVDRGNGALGMPAHMRPLVAEPPAPAADALPIDKSKLRPPKLRKGRTDFPDEATLGASSAEKAASRPESAAPSTAGATPAASNAPGVVTSVVDGASLAAALSNPQLSHSARVAVVRNAAASASADAFAKAFVSALLSTSTTENEKSPQPPMAAQNVASAPSAAAIVAAGKAALAGAAWESNANTARLAGSLPQQTSQQQLQQQQQQQQQSQPMQQQQQQQPPMRIPVPVPVVSNAPVTPAASAAPLSANEASGSPSTQGSMRVRKRAPIPAASSAAPSVTSGVASTIAPSSASAASTPAGVPPMRRGPNASQQASAQQPPLLPSARAAPQQQQPQQVNGGDAAASNKRQQQPQQQQQQQQQQQRQKQQQPQQQQQGQQSQQQRRKDGQQEGKQQQAQQQPAQQQQQRKPRTSGQQSAAAPAPVPAAAAAAASSSSPNDDDDDDDGDSDAGAGNAVGADDAPRKKRQTRGGRANRAKRVREAAAAAAAAAAAH